MSAASAAVRHEALLAAEGPEMGPFARALRGGQGAALRFLDAPPSDASGWRTLLDRTAAAAPRLGPSTVARLTARQVELEAGPRAEANARGLGEGALAVVTGQQPGLLGGPLLTLHKAAGALVLARRLEDLVGRRVVPVFWLASEDHDLDEANRAVVIDRLGQARRLRLPLEADGRSLLDVAVPPDQVTALLEELREALPATARAEDAIAQATPRAGEDLATWCVRVLLRLLGDSGLVVVEPALLASDVAASHAWLLDHAETIQRNLQTCRSALLAAGLPAPLDPPPDSVPLFLRATPGGRRLRIGLGRGATVMLRDESSNVTRAELRARLLDQPWCGSANVIGRVFVQNRLLPVLAYVAGPTEIAYQAQLRAAHEALGCFFPLALPRPEATWIDARSDRVLEAFHASPGAVLAGRDAAPHAEDAELETEVSAVARALAELEGHAPGLLRRGGRGPDALRRALERTRRAWSQAEASVRAAYEADAGTGRARWARMVALLRPHGRPQERLLSPLSLVARHGVAALREGLATLDPLPAVHHLLHLQA